MKKISKIYLCVFLICSLSLQMIISQENRNLSNSSFQLMKDIQFNCTNGYYSSALVLCEKMQTEYPQSKYFQNSLQYKVEALYYLGMKRLAKENLEKLEDVDNISYVAANIYYEDKEFDKCIPLLYKSLRQNKNIDSEKYYDSMDLLSSAFYLINDYQKSFSFAYKIIKDKGYSYKQGKITALFCEILYSKSNYSKIIQVYEKIQNDLTSYKQEYLQKITLISGISYDQMKITDKAQTLYQLIGSFYGETENTSKFWIRMGIQAFQKQDYSEAQRCFTVALKAQDEYSKQLISLYQVMITSKLEDFNKALVQLKQLNIDQEELQIVQKELLVNFAAKTNNLEIAEQNIQYLLNHAKMQSEYEKTNGFQIAMYWYLSMLVNNQNKENLKKIERTIEQFNFQSVYIKNLIANQNPKLSDTIYHQLSENKDLAKEIQNELYENYVMSQLLNSKTDYLSESKTLELPNHQYYIGLAYYLNGEWRKCIKELETCDNLYAKYYLGSSYYMLQENEKAYETFLDLKKLLDKKDSDLLYTSGFLASQCAFSIMLNSQSNKAEWLEKAIISCKDILLLDVTDSKKMDCIIFLTDLYAYTQDYENAINLLEPYTYSNSDESVRCLYKLAQVYSMKGDILQADKLYDRLALEWPSTNYAAESRFNQGKLFFDGGFWGEACDKFAIYRKNFPKGKYYSEVCFYNGVALEKLGNESLAILLLQEALQNSEKNVYRFNSLLELLTLYRNRGDYKQAIEVARKLLVEFPEQSKNEKINQQITEISLLASGEDEKTATLLATYVREGETSTKLGRDAGFNLVKKYFTMVNKRNEGFKIAKVLLASKKIDENTEKEMLAELYSLCAIYYRENLEYQDAALDFLSAAQYYSAIDKQLAAKNLYCAVESYDCALRKSDSTEIFEMMKTLYPDNQWTYRAQVLINNL